MLNDQIDQMSGVSKSGAQDFAFIKKIVDPLQDLYERSEEIYRRIRPRRLVSYFNEMYKNVVSNRGLETGGRSSRGSVARSSLDLSDAHDQFAELREGMEENVEEFDELMEEQMEKRYDEWDRYQETAEDAFTDIGREHNRLTQGMTRGFRSFYDSARGQLTALLAFIETTHIRTALEGFAEEEMESFREQDERIRNALGLTMSDWVEVRRELRQEFREWNETMKTGLIDYHYALADMEQVWGDIVSAGIRNKEDIEAIMFDLIELNKVFESAGVNVSGQEWVVKLMANYDPEIIRNFSDAIIHLSRAEAELWDVREQAWAEAEKFIPIFELFEFSSEEIDKHLQSMTVTMAALESAWIDSATVFDTYRGIMRANKTELAEMAGQYSVLGINIEEFQGLLLDGKYEQATMMLAQGFEALIDEHGLENARLIVKEMGISVELFEAFAGTAEDGVPKIEALGDSMERATEEIKEASGATDDYLENNLRLPPLLERVSIAIRQFLSRVPFIQSILDSLAEMELTLNDVLRTGAYASIIFGGTIKKLGAYLFGLGKAVSAAFIGKTGLVTGVKTASTALLAKGVGLVAGIKALGVVLAPIAGAVWAIHDAFTGWNKSTEWLGEETGETLGGKLVSGFSAAIAGTDEGLSGALKGAAKGLLIGSIFGPVGMAIGAVLGAGLGSVGGEKLSQTLVEWGSLISTFFQEYEWSEFSFSDFVSKFKSEVIDELSPEFGKMIDSFKESWAPVTTWFTTHIAEPLREAFSPFVDLWERIREDVEERLDTYAEKFAELGEKVGEVLGPLGDLWDTVKDLGRALWDLTEPLRSQAFGEFSTLVGLIADGLGLVWDLSVALADLFMENLEPSIDIVAGSLKALEGLIQLTILPLVLTLQGDFTGAASAMEEGWRNFTKGIGQMWEGWIQIVTNTMNFLIDGLNKIQIEVPDWVPGWLGGGETWGFNIPRIGEDPSQEQVMVPFTLPELHDMLLDPSRSVTDEFLRNRPPQSEDVPSIPETSTEPVPQVSLPSVSDMAFDPTRSVSGEFLGSRALRDASVIETPGAAFIQDPDMRLGALAERFESSGRGPGTIGDTPGDAGGLSYGVHQIASATGTLNEFLDWLGGVQPAFRDRLYQGGRPTSPGFNQAWRDLARDYTDEFRDIQHEFIRLHHYDPVRRSVKNATGLDVDTRSQALQEVLFSTAVQHGPGGGPAVFRNAGINPSMTDEQIIRAIYEERGAREGAKYFSSSSRSVQLSVADRFRREMEIALQMLKESMVEIPAAAEGGILTRPQVVLAGEMGPEVILPLDKLDDIMLAGNYESADPDMLRSVSDNSDVVDAIESSTAKLVAKIDEVISYKKQEKEDRRRVNHRSLNPLRESLAYYE